MRDHDNLTELRVEVKAIHETLTGNGSIGLCTRVDSLEETRTIHKVYFVLLGTGLVVAIPLLTWFIERYFGS